MRVTQETKQYTENVLSKKCIFAPNPIQKLHLKEVRFKAHNTIDLHSLKIILHGSVILIAFSPDCVINFIVFVLSSHALPAKLSFVSKRYISFH